MVSSQPGPSGGWFLEREPERITLRDVYRAVEEEQLFSMHHRSPSSSCLVGRNIQEVLQTYFGEAEEAMKEKLGGKTIADVVGAVRDCSKTRVG
jgi:DNA-binding IscR family transcriptional regulator